MTGHHPFADLIKNTPPKKTCHVLMAIDASGSMSKVRDDVIGGFNSYITDLADDVHWIITVVLFNTDVWYLCRGAELGDVPVMTETNYRPRGNTALNDALGDLLTDTPVGVADRILMVVNTDGMENASREFRGGDVQRLIKERDKDPRWGFVFLGATPQSWTAGHIYGMSSGQTVNTSGGTRGAYSGLSTGTRGYMQGQSAESVAQAASEASVAWDAADTSSAASVDPDGPEGDRRGE